MAQNVLTPAQVKQRRNFQGLSEADVENRTEKGLTNDFKARVSRSYWDIVRDNLLNLFNIVLGTLLVIVITLGDYATAFFAGFSVVTNTFLGMIQEISAKRKLDQLATLSEQTVRVFRDGALREISMRAVVVDDIIKVEPGDRIVVDGVVVQSDSLEMDESLLTGESDAVPKEIDSEILSGSFVIAGSGVMRATRVGKESNINQLSAIAKQYKNVKTPTQTYIDIIVEITVVIMFVFVPMLLLSNLVVDQIPFLNAIRNSVVFVTSLVPQGLVLVAILSLTIGAVKISRHETLIQKVNAVESLANATVLCFDKTGTLTQNELAVSEIIALTNDPKEDISRNLYRYLNNLSHVNRTAGAVEAYVTQHLDTLPDDEKMKEIPFSSARKWGAVQFDDGIYALGAPERLLPHTDTEDSVAHRSIKLQSEGMRVLAFCELSSPPGESREFIGDLANPIALIVMSDKIREDIQETLAAFRQENLELKVISGDSIETVRSIAAQSGMDITGAHTGAELDAMSDEELEGVVTQSNVFARVEPDTKRRIVRALQRRKQYVAMVGDGVNDVPALKQADLAIVMNDGTQISKDVADIVLLNNAMSTLPMAFKEGKEITQTIFGTMKIFLVKNFYNVMTFIFILFMGLPFPITPVQISWSTFGTVNMPATLIAFAIIRPKYMGNFRDDVLDFIVTGGLIGSVLLAVLYGIVYFGTGRNIEATRSAVTIFLSFYGAYIIMAVQGVDFYKPRTFLKHWRTGLLMLVLTTFTLLAMYMLPDLFEFYIFDPSSEMWVIILIYTLLVLSIILLAHGTKYRYLLRRMWFLFQNPDRSLNPSDTNRR